jgi:peptidoglycan/LPS O-acetylase OafA/YrhL
MNLNRCNKPNLDILYSLRFFAAITVVLYHFAPSQILIVDFLKIKSFGYEPVSFFFFLSGFILTHAYGNTQFDGIGEKKQFLFKRLSKLGPVYISALVMCSILNFHEFNQTSSFSFRFFLEITMLQSLLFKTSLNFPAWSISCELLFYVLFPILIQRIRIKLIRDKIIIMIVIFSLSISFFNMTKDLISNVQYFPFIHLHTFIIGIISYTVFFSSRHSQILTKYNALIILGAVLLIVFLMSSHVIVNHNNGWFALIYFFLIPAFCYNKLLNNVFSNDFFILLGKSSYSLYILQFPIWLLFNLSLYNIGIEFSNELFSLFIFFLIVISIISYKLIENPLDNYFRAKFIN